MSRLADRALVLRATPYREADLVVDLLTAQHGRLAVLARGARQSRRRFGGALEIGTRIEAQIESSRGLATLVECDVVGTLGVVRQDLRRIAHLSYVLEITKLFSREGEKDEALYGLTTGFIDALEAAPASDEALALWEVALLAHLGYALQFGPCRLTGGPAEALSLSAGGTVVRGATADAEPLSPSALATLEALARGQVTARFPPADEPEVRRAFARTWARLAGHPLRSAPFLLPPGNP